MTNQSCHDPIPGWDDSPPPPKSGRQKAWEVLLQIAPELEHVHKTRNGEPRPPAEISDQIFLGLVACLLDPVKRAVITAIITDMIDDHVKEQIANILFKDES